LKRGLTKPLERKKKNSGREAVTARLSLKSNGNREEIKIGKKNGGGKKFKKTTKTVSNV